MASKKVLGRGLGAFFPEYQEEGGGEAKESPKKEGVEKNFVEPEERVNIVLDVPVDHIRANPHQPRKEFDEDKLDELGASIKKHGLIQPITVRYIGEKRFELISGERRLRAAKLAGIQEIPAYIRQADDEQSMAFALIENIQREQLNPLEVAMGYKRLLEEFDYTQAEVAERVGKNRTTVTNMLRLLNLPDFIQKAVKSNQISMGHARALITIEDEELQKKILDKVIAQGLSVRQIEQAVRESTQKKESKSKSKPSAGKDPNNPFYEDISARLRRTFSTKVNVQPKKKGGEIRIEYYSEDDLERILGIFDSID
ncbi:ParB/RepB/Spo0J family partition protein [Gracilimonas mengyeensis]|uniref:Chromosome partitioning protein, ParB family n=1 Tax=Gracilimonas mengyeensis TaxID=1302730 RepID=A0A521ESI1_9BACT|nr:ParB/RepB/Spo0J family partition protein [Gracilimonas mengyeensis]SMO86060.1 chromosome partitioning protein, ParB family [Gracilimonas mengyeensis]